MKTSVLHIIYSLYRGGAERSIETLLLGSSAGKYIHTVCALEDGGDLVHRFRSLGTEVVVMEKSRRGRLSLLPRLSSLIGRTKPDILHLHNSPAGFWGTIASVTARPRIPIVRTEHSPWRPDGMNPVYRALYPRLASRASSIIAVSDHARRSYTDRFPFLGERFITIHNGIDPSSFLALPDKRICRSILSLPPDGMIAGTVGRLVPVKNHLLLLEAFATVRKAVPDSHLAILGDGSLEPALRLAAIELGIHTVVSFFPPTPEVARFLSSLDIFVLSSDSEGLPLTLLEAMASRIPSVATSVGGIPEVIRDGDNGILVPAGSPAALAGGMVELMKDRSKRLSVGDRGVETIKNRFSAERFIEETEAVYDKVLQTGR